MTRHSASPRGRFTLSAMFDRWSVQRQLFAAFGSLMLMMAALGGMAVWGLQHVDRQAESLSDKWLQGVGQLATARNALLELRDLEVKHSRTDDRSYHAEYEDKMAAAREVLGSTLAAYAKSLAAADERALYGQLEAAHGAYEQARGKVVSLGKAKAQQDAADVSDGMGSTSFDEAIGALDALNRYNFEQGEAAARQAGITYEQVLSGVVALLAVALLAAGVLGWGISRQLLRQLGGEPRLAAQVARSVAAGDLSTPLTVRQGDADSLMACLRSMQLNLSQAVSAVRSGSEQVATASSQIAQGNHDLSGRTEQQASALQQTTATMEELGSTVRNNADNARQANQLALSASGVAAKGGDVVNQVVATMKGINDSSRKIADIIGTIDGIAFQTNILALNAAVEAARAGEQGRGFAVVAGEVRNLAQRSAEAAREIKQLISASVERVEQGTSLVDQAGNTMQEVVAAIRRVTDIVGEISVASGEQSSGVAQVGEAVSQMDQATQQNAALVEQSAAAAESLRQQAQQLVQAVAVFKLAHA